MFGKLLKVSDKEILEALKERLSLKLVNTGYRLQVTLYYKDQKGDLHEVCSSNSENIS